MTQPNTISVNVIVQQLDEARLLLVEHKRALSTVAPAIFVEKQKLATAHYSVDKAVLSLEQACRALEEIA